MNKSILYKHHSDLGAEFDEDHFPKHYNYPLEEYKAVRESVGLIDLSYRGKLIIKGADQADYLQRMLTNDVKKLNTGEGVYATYLTPKGKMISDMNIYKLNDTLLMDLEPNMDVKVSELLLKTKFNAEFEIENQSDDLLLLSVQGKKSQDILKEVFGQDISLDEYRCTVFNFESTEVILVSRNRTGEGGYDLYVPNEKGIKLWEKLLAKGKAFNIKAFGKDTLEILRIESAIPKYGVDLTEERNPLEAGIENAISFNKGCYVGQEAVARMKYRGHSNWFLVGLIIEGENVNPMDKLKLKDKAGSEDKEIGHITSSAFSPGLSKNIALAFIRKEHKESGTKVVIETKGPKLTAEVVETPFIKVAS